SPGTWYILFRADRNGSVAESSESNNVSWRTITVLPNTAPDLVVQNTSASPTSVAAGNTISLSCRVRNTGTASTGRSSSLGYYLSSNTTYSSNDISLGTDFVTTLSPNNFSSESISATIPAGTSPGTWYILFRADRNGSVAESNENNNVSWRAITVLPDANPDLVVQNTSASPSSVTAGNSISLSCRVRNTGNASTGGASTLGYYLSSNTTYSSSDIALGTDYVTSLSAGSSSNESIIATIPAGTSPGTWYILFRADRNGSISESSESNNVSWRAITVLADTAPDLVVQNTSASPTSVAAGSTVSLSCRVRNTGTASTGGGSTLGYYLSSNTTYSSNDIALGSDYVTTLSPNNFSSESITATIPAGTSPGTWYILFRADRNGSISESSESNNVSWRAITVLSNARPDLVVQNMAASPTGVAEGGTISLSCRVYNNGAAATGSASTLGYYLSSNTTYSSNDISLGSDYVTSLSPNNYSSESLTATIPAGTSPGTWYILFRADRNGSVAESNESNNISWRAITVLPSAAPDLVVDNAVASPTTIEAGSSISLSCRVRNAGTGSTGGSSTLGYYLSSNTTYGSSDISLGTDFVSTLSAGNTSVESLTATLPAGTSPGTWYILFRADRNESIAESSENNNVSYRAITVTGSSAPDLVVQNTTASPTSIMAGSSIALTCRVRNTGNATTGRSSTLGYYLSSNTTYSTNDIALGTDYVTTLAPNNFSSESITATIPAGTSPGTWYILYRADMNGSVAEADENNNVAFRAITITGGSATADLVVENPAINRTDAEAGANVVVSCRVRNVGSSSTNSASEIGYYLSDDPVFSADDIVIGDDYVTTLAANAYSSEIETITIPASTSPGVKYILFVADHNAEIAESSESNNVNFRSILVAASSPPGNGLSGDSDTEGATNVSQGITDAFVGESMLVYPNPTQGVVNVGQLLVGDVLKVIDQNGVVQRVILVQDATMRIDLSTAPKGFYFLQRVSGKEQTVTRIFLQ
ncbi:MAG: CARDB domain-containing protein, partial [Bacteroidota bacterium]